MWEARRPSGRKYEDSGSENGRKYMHPRCSNFADALAKTCFVASTLLTHTRTTPYSASPAP